MSGVIRAGRSVNNRFQARGTTRFIEIRSGRSSSSEITPAHSEEISLKSSTTSKLNGTNIENDLVPTQIRSSKHRNKRSGRGRNCIPSSSSHERGGRSMKSSTTIYSSKTNVENVLVPTQIRSLRNRNERSERGRNYTRNSSTNDSCNSFLEKGQGRGDIRFHHPNKSNKHSKKPEWTISSDFLLVHQNCKAARYKVHRPGCSCSKMKEIRSFSKRPCNDGTLSPQREEHKYNTKNLALDGLVVVPDNNTKWLYLCPDTQSKVFEADPKEAELKLRQALFPTDHHNFKVSCAQCLLQVESNGFICISSTSRSVVDLARDMARTRASQKKSKGELHADHAHYICTLPRNDLWKLCQRGNRRDLAGTRKDILGHLIKQGVRSSVDISTDDGDGRIPIKINLGHHLQSVLYITQKDADAKTAQILTIIYDDTPDKGNLCYTIDLPGGKRHLGETSFECAVRETEEEISLIIDKQWIDGETPRKSRGDITNEYYMLKPPSDMVMESVVENPFWHNTGLCK